jgi:putative oxidoreductase
MAMVPTWFVSLLTRFAVASLFWRSVQTKISGWGLFEQSWKFWNVSESTFLLFENEYSVPLLPVKLAAYLATFGEFFLSIAIVLGLLTRLSAVGLLIMTAVIQVFVYPDAWNIHILWAALLFYLIKYGGGTISIDYLLHKKMT